MATLHAVPGVSMLRPAEAVFEKTLQGFADHQRARRLSKDTVRQRFADRSAGAGGGGRLPVGAGVEPELV
ncbi:MAG: hypothetical protein ACRDTT_30025 [Pseudonocardiaceae bacterium]